MNLTKSLIFTAALAVFVNSSAAVTIIKLGFSTDPLGDIELVDSLLSTVDDGVGSNLGDQNTEVTFLGPLGSQPAIPSDNASFTLDGVSINGPPTIIANTIIQETASGAFQLYDQNDNLLLAGTLGAGILSGPIGGTATGGFLTAEFGNFTSGSLLSSLGGLTQSSVSFSLTDVNGGAGFSTDQTGALNPFQADATANIGAIAPEPTSLLLPSIGMVCMAFALRRRR